MSRSQPIRMLLLAGILIIVALAVRGHVESGLPAPPPEEYDEVARPPIKVARETGRTIVESNEDWLQSGQSRSVEESAGPLGDQRLPDLPPTPARGTESIGDGLLRR